MRSRPYGDLDPRSRHRCRHPTAGRLDRRNPHGCDPALPSRPNIAGERRRSTGRTDRSAPRPLRGFAADRRAGRQGVLRRSQRRGLIHVPGCLGDRRHPRARGRRRLAPRPRRAGGPPLRLPYRGLGGDRRPRADFRRSASWPRNLVNAFIETIRPEIVTSRPRSARDGLRPSIACPCSPKGNEFRGRTRASLDSVASGRRRGPSRAVPALETGPGHAPHPAGGRDRCRVARGGSACQGSRDRPTPHQTL